MPWRVGHVICKGSSAAARERFAVPLFAIGRPATVCMNAAFLWACSGTVGFATEPAHCAAPDMPAHVVAAAPLDEPPIAQQQGISGLVFIAVSLDSRSRVTSAIVRKSPSELLNAAAVKAARESLYATTVSNCVTVPSMIVVAVRFAADSSTPPRR